MTPHIQFRHLRKGNRLRQQEAGLGTKLATNIQSARVPRSGAVFFVPVRKLSIPMVLVRKEKHGLWLCCKLSLNVHEATRHDLILRAHPQFSSPVGIQSWNVTVLHEQDIKDFEFFPVFSKQEISWVWALFRSHQQSNPVPKNLRFITGTEFTDEFDPRWDFYLREMSIVELIRLKYHEGYE